ncbi:MAG: hypothetical protein EA341_04260 [Mongoliibacter sp.]|uniref:hypothetical protein n=1 Tax=Mongoliibacter sp. TaxID=2022438 RepID=UPI0012F0F940|nr:hypothetical protein [Mongoliibacter sp.]TVP51882.1 MAG: hypothetical protein EA341_04260 [Mongoliibacter sp.]
MKIYLLCFFIFAMVFQVQSQISLDIESGIIFPGYNEVRIPNEQGTTFDFNSDFQIQGPVIPLRIRPGYSFGKNHVFGLYAPLSANYLGTPGFPINFQNSQFDGNNEIEGFYKFNSYRLTYRRDLIQSEKWILGVGFTGKIRDARVSLTQGGTTDFKDDVGFVPLLHLFASYDTGGFTAMIEGDGLAGGPGRAFDFFGGVRVPVSNYFDLKAGYRILEGGAEISEVYNFAFFNFASVGIVWGLR